MSATNESSSFRKRVAHLRETEDGQQRVAPEGRWQRDHRCWSDQGRCPDGANESETSARGGRGAARADSKTHLDRASSSPLEGKLVRFASGDDEGASLMSDPAEAAAAAARVEAASVSELAEASAWTAWMSAMTAGWLMANDMLCF